LLSKRPRYQARATNRTTPRTSEPMKRNMGSISDGYACVLIRLAAPFWGRGWISWISGSVEPRPQKGAAKPAALSKEEPHLLVQELPDAVEQRVAHRVVAAADARVDLGAGDEQLGRQAVALGDVGAVHADPGHHHRLGLVVRVLVRVGLRG